MKRRFWILTFFYLQSFLSAEEFIEYILDFDPMCIYIDQEYLFSIRRNQGRSLGSPYSYTTLEEFAFPFHYQNIWPFLDLQIHRFDHGSKYAGNVGLGFRVCPEWGEQIFGFNAFYDFRNHRHGNFNQLGLGFELLGPCFNFRLNSYLPIGRKKLFESSSITSFDAGYFVLQEDYLNSLYGVDFEVEGLIGRICCTDIYLAIGSYYYSGNKCRDDLYGARYRLSACFCDYFNLSIVDTHDCCFKNRIQAEIGITIPFCGSSSCCDLFQRIRRNELILSDRRSRWIWNY